MNVTMPRKNIAKMITGILQYDIWTQIEQKRPRRPHTSAQGGSASNWLLLSLLATTISTCLCADDTSAERDDPISECRRFYASQPQPLKDMHFWTGAGGQDFVEKRVRSREGWLLENFFHLHALDTMDEDSTWTTLCVGLVDTTSHTYKNSYEEYPTVWVTFHTLRQEPIGLVRLKSLCWLNSKHIAGCDPSFTPMPYIAELPLYHYSPLEEDFWTNLTVDSLGVKPHWMWRINTQTNEGSIPAHWIYNMHIPSLKSLDIMGNNWKRPENIVHDMPNLEKLDLSTNNLEVLPDEMLKHMPVLQKLILGHNNISKLPQSVRQLTNLGLLDLTNPIGNATLQITDEDLENLPKSVQILGLENTKLHANASKIFLLPNLRFLNLSGCALGHIKDHQFVNAKSKLTVVDLSHNNLKYIPQNIFTAMPNLKNFILTNNSLEEWPEEILIKNALTHLYLSHNYISNLTSETFRNLKELELLDLSSNKIEFLFDTMFQTLQNLKNIDISNNKLTSIPDMLFNYTFQLTVINLSNNILKQGPNLWELNIKNLDLSYNNLSYFRNNISSIENVDLSYNRICNLDISSAVKKMNISYNSMPYISPVLWSNFSQLNDLDIGANDFECCRFVNRTYLNEPHIMHISNLGSSDPLTCSINRTAPKILLQTFVYNETECNPELIKVPTPFGLAVVLPITILVLTGTLVAVMMYVYRLELTYVSHLFRMKKIGAETDEQRYKTCVYDAFVCYSAKNFEWVMRILLPGLENGPEGYRLCVHDRDFALGAGINRNIVASLEKSRKVIFVLSGDFIASKWCQWELEMANHKMFEEKRNYIILVELERLPRQQLPRHLRYLMDRTTYLEWPESEAGLPEAKQQLACLKRLREALGDSLRQRTGRDNGGFFTVLDAP